MLAAVAACGQTTAADDRAIDDLNATFEADPSRGFEAAMAMFGDAQAAGDMDAMMSAFHAVFPWTQKCYWRRPLEEMADVVIPLTEAQGNWLALSQVYAALSDPSGWLSGTINSDRSLRFAGLAVTAAERAGVDERSISRLERDMATCERESSLYKGHPGHLSGRKYAPGVSELVSAAEQALNEARDADVVQQAERILAAADADPEGQLANPYALLMGWAWVRGMQPLIPAVLNGYAASFRGDREEFIGASLGLLWAWDGKPGPELDGLLVLLSWVAAGRVDPANPVPGMFANKLRAFGWHEESRRALQVWIDAYQELSHGWYSVNLAWPGIPGETRAALLDIFLRCRVNAQDVPQLRSGIRRFAPDSDDAEKRAWSMHVARSLVQVVPQFTAAASQTELLTLAADHFEAADCPDLAAGCRALAKSIAESDPKAMLQLALTSARATATEGRWEDVAKALEDAATKQSNTQETLQAALLLYEAYLRLGKPTEAETWIGRAWELVNSLTMSPAEKANYLMSMANLCDLAVQLAERKVASE